MNLESVAPGQLETFHTGYEFDYLRRLAVNTSKREWRPTVAALVFCRDPVTGQAKVCGITEKKVRRGKEVTTVGIPKGGVDEEDASVYEALLRELKEEILLDPRFILQTEPLGFSRVGFSKAGRGRDGFSKGKLYLLYAVLIEHMGCVSPNHSHNVIGADWFFDLRDHLVNETRKWRLLTSPGVENATQQFLERYAVPQIAAL